MTTFRIGSIQLQFTTLIVSLQIDIHHENVLTNFKGECHTCHPIRVIRSNLFNSCTKKSHPKVTGDIIEVYMDGN